jgi:branched-chain amino acid transport system substrate-binding protein
MQGLLLPRVALVCFISFCLVSRAMAQTVGDEIVLGASLDLSSTLKERGKGVVEGISAYIAEINKAGGINGRRVKFIPIDDKYLPAESLNNVQVLVKKDHVFALIGNTGTANSRAIMPYIQSGKTPLVFPATGSSLLTNPVKKNVFAFRADYHQEGAMLMKYVVGTTHLKDIAIITQDDALGADGLSGALKELASLGLKPVKTLTVSKSSKDFTAAVAEIRASKPAVVYVQTNAVASLAIAKLLRQSEKPLLLLFASAANAHDIVSKLGASSGDIIFTEPLPLSTDNSFELVKSYQKSMSASGYKDFSSYSLEGYAAVRLLCEAVKAVGKDLTREKFITALESMKDFDLSGIKINLSPTDHQAIGEPFLYSGKNGEVTRIEF